MRQAKQHPVLGPGTVHASMIRGGEEASSYPSECRITIERRTIPGETGDTVEAELAAMLDGLTSTVPDFRYRLERGLERPPFEADRDHPIVTTLSRQATTILGKTPGVRGEPFWTDCALMQAAGIPVLMFGADGGGAHAATEWTMIESVRALTAILEATVAEFCA